MRVNLSCRDAVLSWSQLCGGMFEGDGEVTAKKTEGINQESCSAMDEGLLLFCGSDCHSRSTTLIPH